MTSEVIRLNWTALRNRLDAQGQATKVPQAAIVELSRRYLDLDPDARGVVDELISEWVLSDDENLRFDALALISDHRIEIALPALENLLVRLNGSTNPGAPYEQKKVRRIITRLESQKRNEVMK